MNIKKCIACGVLFAVPLSISFTSYCDYCRKHHCPEEKHESPIISNGFAGWGTENMAIVSSGTSLVSTTTTLLEDF